MIASNPAKESFFLLDLFQELKNVGTALGEFKCNHGKYVSVTGIKHLEVMVQSLELIYSAGTKQVAKISSVKYLPRAYKLKETAIKRKNAKDPMHVALRGAVSGLRGFVRRCKKARAEVLKEENDPPQPMPFYKEPRRSGRGPSPISTKELLQKNFTGLPPQGVRKWTKETLA